MPVTRRAWIWWSLGATALAAGLFSVYLDIRPLPPSLLSRLERVAVLALLAMLVAWDTAAGVHWSWQRALKAIAADLVARQRSSSSPGMQALHTDLELFDRDPEAFLTRHRDLLMERERQKRQLDVLQREQQQAEITAASRSGVWAGRRSGSAHSRRRPSPWAAWQGSDR